MRLPSIILKACSSLAEGFPPVSPSLPEDLRLFLSENGTGRVELHQNVAPGIATLCLNHPEKKNAFCGRMILDLQSALSVLESSSTVTGLVVYGNGNSFCSGADLRMVRQTLGSSWARIINDIMRSCFTRLQHLPAVTVAMLNGHVVGGGAELAACCDFRLATTSTKIQFVHARLGISTAWGGGTRLTQILGPTHALRLLCGSSILNLQDSLDLGFVEKVNVDDEENRVEASVHWLYELVHKGVPEAVRAMKRVVTVASSSVPTDLALLVEKDEGQVYSDRPT